MMAPTHRQLGATWWLVLTVGANHAGAHIHPATALAGAVVAARCSYGRWSPDADTTWLAGLGHRQATHRPGTAGWLTVVTLTVWLAVWLAAGPPTPILDILWAPVTGWWSHLLGDAIFGRIPVAESTGRALAAVLPRVLPRRAAGHVLHRSRRGRQSYWVGLGLDTDGLVERGNRRLPERTPSGLHRVTKVLPFAPTTALLRVSTVILAITALMTWSPR